MFSQMIMGLVITFYRVLLQLPRVPSSQVGPTPPPSGDTTTDRLGHTGNWLLLPSRAKTAGEDTERSNLPSQKGKEKGCCLQRASCQRRNVTVSQSTISLALQKLKGKKASSRELGQKWLWFCCVVVFFFPKTYYQLC